MSAYGCQRTSVIALQMFAFEGKADIGPFRSTLKDWYGLLFEPRRRQ